MSLVLFKFTRQLALITQSHIVEERNACNPVAVFPFSISLDIILSSSKVPHKVAPIHEVNLVAKEETKVLELSRRLYLNHISTPFIALDGSLHSTHPTLVSGRMLLAIHTREEHVLLIDIVRLITLNLVAIGLFRRLLFLSLIDRSTLFANRNTVVSVGLEQNLAGVSWTIK